MDIVSSVMQDAHWIGKESAIDKEAAFPPQFTLLDKNTKNQISRSYGVGPKSEQKQINPSDASKKPYKDQLLLYTLKTLSQTDQKKMRDDMRKIDDELRKDPKFQELKGSRAGHEYEEEFKEKKKKDIERKYKEKEYPVAWGEGTNFRVNNDMFHYYWGGRGRSSSDAPTSRKQLIDLMNEKGGKVYAISEDPDLAIKRKERRETKPDDERDQLVKQVKQRAAKYAKAKKDEVFKLIDEYAADVQKILLSNLANVPAKMKKGGYFAAGEIQKSILDGINWKFMDAAMRIVDKLGDYEKGSFQSYGWRKPQDDLINFTKEVNALINSLKK